MALFSAGPGVSEIRGSSNGVTFSRNRFGMYIRQRSVPVNPQSSRQAVVRGYFNDLATRYRDTLSPAQRSQWQLYAENTSWLNKLGQQIYLTGQNQYIRSNSIALVGDVSLYDDAPSEFGIPAQETLWTPTASEATQEISIAYTFAADEDDQVFAFYMGRPRSASRNYYGGPWRHIGNVIGDSTTPPASPAPFDVAYPIQEGQLVTVYCRRLDTDGRLTQPFRQDLTVAA